MDEPIASDPTMSGTGWLRSPGPSSHRSLCCQWSLASGACRPSGAAASPGPKVQPGSARLVPAMRTRQPAVLLNEGIAAPITDGLLRPAITLPADAVTWSEVHLANALLHELEHVREHMTGPCSWLRDWRARCTGSIRWRGSHGGHCGWKRNGPAMMPCWCAKTPRPTQSNCWCWRGAWPTGPDCRDCRWPAAAICRRGSRPCSTARGRVDAPAGKP